MFDTSSIPISTTISGKSFIEQLPQVKPKLPSLNSDLEHRISTNFYEIYNCYP